MNTLAEIRDGPAVGLDFETFRRRKALVMEVQGRLAALGLLDPPADGDFGPVSLWAWRTFCARHDIDDLTRITADLARQLLVADANEFYPMRVEGGDLVSRVVRSMQALGYWIARPYWGLGFATEAARAVMSMARATAVRDIRAAHFADNPASGNVLRKLGFNFSGRVERRYSPARGTSADCLVFEEGVACRMWNDSADLLYSDAMPALAA